MFILKIMLSLIFLNQIGQTVSTHSGVKMQLSQRGLDYAAGIASNILKRNILNKNLGSVTGDSGEFHYGVTDVKITEYIQTSSTALIDKDTSSIAWTLSIESLTTTAGWNYSMDMGFLRLKDRGALSLEAKNLAIVVSVTFGYNHETGRPTIRTTGCTCSVMDIDLKFSGRNRNLYNILSSAFKEGIKEMVEEELCESARNEIDETGNEELSTLIVDVALTRDLYFDYRLTAHPEIKDGYVETSHVGMAFGGRYPREAFQNPQPEMDVEPGNEMVSFLISEDSLSSYGRILVSKGTRTLINRNDLPDDQKELLEADCGDIYCFAEMMPSFARDYPGSSFEIELQSETGLPKLHIRPYGLYSNVSGEAVTSLRLSNGSRIELATTRLHTLFNITASIEGHILKLKLLDIIPYMSVNELSQSGVSEEGLRYAFNILSKVVMDRINENIKEGVPVIKTRGVGWENTRIVFHDQFLRLSADLKYLNV